MTITKAIVLRTNKLLEKRKMTKRQLARRAGISEGTLASVCRQITGGVSLSTVFALARGFDMTAAEFLDDAVFEEIEVK
jgi:transcriptional regulator with XRE-family HTH domain